MARCLLASCVACQPSSFAGPLWGWTPHKGSHRGWPCLQVTHVVHRPQHCRAQGLRGKWRPVMKMLAWTMIFRVVVFDGRHAGQDTPLTCLPLTGA